MALGAARLLVTLLSSSLGVLPAAQAVAAAGAQAPPPPAPPPPSATGPQEQVLLLEVHINGHATGKIGQFVQRGAMLWAGPGELRELGLRPPENAPDDAAPLPLSALPGLDWRLVESTQTLHITAPVERLETTLLAAMSGGGEDVPYQSGSGAVLDYDLVGFSSADANSASGLFDLRAFSPWGVASSGLLTHFGGDALAWQQRTVRLDTVLVHSDPQTLRRYRLGDVISGGLAWSRPVRLGGLRVSSDFSMRPDLITFPLPTLGGAATVPSTVDVLVNGQRVLSREVPPGPFEVPQLPVVTGAGTITLNVTDALGRQTTQTLPFYAASQLLAPGLQTYSLEAGALRRNWGSVSNDYGDTVASASYRRGLSARLTAETHAEAASGLGLFGAGLVANLADLAVANLAAAASTGDGERGLQLSAGLQHLGRVFSVSAQASFAGRQFSDLGTIDGDPVPWRQIYASAGLALGGAGSFGLAYAGIDRDGRAMPRWYAPSPGTVPPIGYYDLQAQHQRMLTASYSVQVGGRASLYATAYKDFAPGGSSGAMLGVTLPLGSRGASASTSIDRSGGETSFQLQAQRSADTVGEWGYRLYHAGGQSTHDTGELSYKSPWLFGSIGVDQMSQQTSWRAQARGALVTADGGLFASNIINDSFAVVDTEGAPDIRVRYENRDMGRTDGAGRLLVPELRSFEINQLSIEPTDVPPDASIATTQQKVRPMDRSGVVVKFPIRTVHSALLRLVDASGKPLPLGSTLTLEASGAVLPVGYDGEAYAEDLQAHNVGRGEFPDGRRCVVRFDYRPVQGDIPSLGPLTCREEK
ncbi:fimbria/pilus outer membrane usher protein [Immundisolibacter sp.]|uniref:fimbria/pilus outer membrane usher protein n=1 Tax=Immundisolibacter sp. TaxID=1934948 RepID=UPI00261B04B5|nr:fimbria/pilus outer membrane usher protein [Immundisolibacter sp.]MDD3651956.1 fimbria/pilus outer membrane usher protein [Immundisolibacter sp.]